MATDNTDEDTGLQLKALKKAIKWTSNKILSFYEQFREIFLVIFNLICF